MIVGVPADVVEALYRVSTPKNLRVTWTFNDGQALDVTDRLIRPLPQISRALRLNLGGFSQSRPSIALKNKDRFLSPRGPKSIVANKSDEDINGSRVLIEQGVFGQTSGFFYFPIYRGHVQDIGMNSGVVELQLGDSFSVHYQKTITEQHHLDPTKSFSEHIQDVLTIYGEVTSSDIDTTTFTFAQNVQDDLDWIAFGTLPENMSVGDAVNGLARSGLGTVYANEDGTIVYHTEFPDISGNKKKQVFRFPEVLDKTKVRSFHVARSSSNYASEVTIRYQGVKIKYRDPAIADPIEAKVGPFPLNLDMPYLMFGRCARQAARVIYGMNSRTLEVVTAVLGNLGLLIQLNDRVKIHDTENDIEDTYRVLMKGWSEESGVAIGAVREWHREDYLEETNFAELDVTSWTSTTARWW